MFKSSTIFKLFSIFSFVIFGIVFLKLFYLQVIQGEKYEKMVEVQSDPRLSVFTDRGYIYDKDGRLLARNKSAGSLYARKLCRRRIRFPSWLISMTLSATG